MARYAQVTGGIVTAINVTTANPAEGWIEVGPDVALGWTYDGETFSAPAAAAPTPRALTRLEFEVLVQAAAGLTAEQFMAALDDQSAEMRLLWRRLGIATQVEKENPLVQAGWLAMVAASHLTQAQVDAINAAWPEG
ncbi:hypothetical protein [Pararhodobacter sp. CCB-MM2]|uniref:hypothetical protein n=1 Tax=Pararhodobacter sp. CCB-MM2 TaxID=1786003 RepID=UPI00082DD493|nr:hypothetical protein [Pararhodobacter sp. CCB-MM2]